MNEELSLDTEEKVRAFTHPYRLKLLHALQEMREPATATDVARKLGDGPGKAHYHMRILETAGIVRVARTESVNGILARYYEPTAKRFAVKGSAIGPGGDASLRDDVARLITARFRDGLRNFLDRTTKTDPQCDETAAPGGFLYDVNLYCTDEEWLAVRATLEELTERFAEKRPDARPRKMFIAGASDTQGDASPAESDALRDPDLRWTFGISFRDPSARFGPLIPPAH